jgi:hypothetical protein
MNQEELAESGNVASQAVTVPLSAEQLDALLATTSTSTMNSQSATPIAIKCTSSQMNVPMTPEEFATSCNVASQTTPVLLSVEQLDALLSTKLDDDSEKEATYGIAMGTKVRRVKTLAQGRKAEQMVSAAENQSKTRARSMVRSSEAPLKGLRHNWDAKVSVLEHISQPMEPSKSQGNLEPAASIGGSLDTARQEPTVEEILTMLARGLLAQEKMQEGTNCQEDSAVSIGPMNQPPLEERGKSLQRCPPNEQLQVQQPGAYYSEPGGFIRRNDSLSFNLVAPTPANSGTSQIPQLPVSSGDQQPSIEVTEYSIGGSTTDTGLVEARAVTEESIRNMSLETAEEVDDIELAKDLMLTSTREQEERECLKVGYCIITVSLLALAISLGIGLGMREVDIITAAPSMSPSMTPSSVPSSAPTGHLDLLQRDLPIYTQDSLQNSSTPQWKAFDWLSNHQNITNLPEWRKKQLFALATFFYAFEGENWPDIIQGEWMDDKVDECLWFSNIYGFFDSNEHYEEGLTEGVAPLGDPCNINGEFQSLVLSNLELSDLTPSIPREMALLSALSVLLLPLNNISVPLSDILHPELSMTNMTQLLLGENFISGSIPSELGRMTQMSAVWLSANSLVGLLPSELGRMTNIAVLDLGGNLMSGALPSELGMTKMAVLYLEDNSFSGTIFSEIGGMTSLVELDIAGNSLSGTIPSSFGQLAHLAWLDLSYLAMLTGPIPSELALMTSLRYFDLTGSGGLSGIIPTDLCYLQNSSSCFFLDWFGVNYSCHLAFDCSDTLCGCDCPCGNSTVSNATD